MPEKAFKRHIEWWCNEFPFVRWDRFVEWFDEGRGYTVAGWIARDDGKSDFITLDFYSGGRIDYMTSSKQYSLEIFKILNAGDGRGHRNCKRVEEHFRGVKNAIKL